MTEENENHPPELSQAELEELERQLSQVRMEDLLTQTVASLLNLSARRIMKEDEVDLAQARLGIDAARAIGDLLPDEIGAALREPLSQLQLLYAQRSGGDDAPEKEAPGEPGKGDSGLWVPGS